MSATSNPRTQESVSKMVSLVGKKVVRFPNPLALGSWLLTIQRMMMMLIFSTARRVKGCPRGGFSTALERWIFAECWLVLSIILGRWRWLLRNLSVISECWSGHNSQVVIEKKQLRGEVSAADINSQYLEISSDCWWQYSQYPKISLYHWWQYSKYLKISLDCWRYSQYLMQGPRQVGAVGGGGSSGGGEEEEIFYLQLAQLLALTLLLTLL